MRLALQLFSCACFVLVAGSAIAQRADRAKISAPAALFYKAFYLDQGRGQSQRALELYERFLAKHAQHRLASRVARRALDCMLRSKQAERAKAFRKAHAALLAVSAKPGINSGFLDPKMDPKRYVQRFEGESREVYLHRGRLLRLMRLEPGMVVADIGAGTGLFTWPIARAVGAKGKAYAVEISDGMLKHLGQQKARRKLGHVQLVACSDRSCALPQASCDVVWICDTYHHFEFPQDTLASIRRALRPGGQLLIVDFERIPGVTRPWILGHVRAGKAMVRKEIEAAGFRFVREEQSPLEENYFLRFERTKG